jgi:hypothetical protein
MNQEVDKKIIVAIATIIFFVFCYTTGKQAKGTE